MYSIRIDYNKTTEMGTLYAVLICYTCDSGEMHDGKIFKLSNGNYASEVHIMGYKASPEGLLDLKEEVQRTIKEAKNLIERRRYAEKKFNPFSEKVEI